MERSSRGRPGVSGQYDVIVVGGGINGVAIARQCALGGRRTLVVEQHDFAAGTTSRSTRIIHGGLRYLEHGELGLVRESLRERERLLNERPHLVRPMHFLLAMNGNSSRSALQVRVGVWLYRRYAGSRNSGCDVRRFESLLDSGRAWHLFNYEDAQCEFPERLVAEWLGDAMAAGATARNHTQVLAVESNGSRVGRLLLRDLTQGTEEWVVANWIINATGPWVDRFAQQCGMARRERMIGGVRGSHIVLPNFIGAPRTALYTEASDHRPIFFVPWNGQVLVGTTEVPDDSDPGCTRPSSEEIDYLLKSVQQMFPTARMSASDIRYAFAGVRPLPFSPGQKSAAISRRHFLTNHADEGAANVISVIGGKLTTAASLARECAELIGVTSIEPSHTWIPGPADTDFEALLARFASRIAGEGKIPEAAAKELVEWFGPQSLGIAELAKNDERTRAPLCEHSNHVVAEAVHAMRAEAAVTLGDVLLRRAPVALSGCWDDECSSVAAQRIGEVLGWSESRIGLEREAFDAERDGFLVNAKAGVGK